MLIEMKTVSPRLSGHHAALFLGALSAVRDAVALATGHDTESVLGRLNAIRLPVDAFDRGADARRAGRASRGRLSMSGQLALAGRAYAGDAFPRYRAQSPLARAAADALASDPALRAVVLQGLLHGASSDDGFALESVEGGSITAVIREDFGAVARGMKWVLDSVGGLLLPGADPEPLRDVAARETYELASPPRHANAAPRSVPPAKTPLADPREHATAIMVAATLELRAVAVQTKATSFRVLDEDVGADDVDAPLPTMPAPVPG